ncbi:MAG: nucleotide sugar dehydrogenase [Flavobacteriales bacterium]
MKIAIFGLGYVGVVNMVCFSKLGHEVWGCDVKSQKVDAINSGKSPIYEPGVDELLSEGIQKGLIHASTNTRDVLENADVVLVCVGTPSTADGKVNLDYTENTTLDMVDYLKEGNKTFRVVYRSTIPPGTIEHTILPHFKTLEPTVQPVVAFLPEFLREGSAIKDFFNCSRIVVGTNDESDEVIKALLSFDQNIPLVFTDYKTAEFVKYVDNAFHAMKIAFANEVYGLGSEYGVNVEKANEIFLLDKHLNIAPTYLRPGLPFGGSCLPKDLRAIQNFAVSKNYDIPVLSNIIQSNNLLLNRMIARVVNSGFRKVGMYGLTFKSGTDDVRESPMLRLFNALKDHGIELKIYDQDINLTTLRIEQAAVVKHIANSPEEAFIDAEGIVVCKKGFESIVNNVPSTAHIFNFYSLKDFDIANPQERLYS